MATIKVTGGKPLNGGLWIEPNKNEVLPLIAATLLTKEECVIRNSPRSPDVLKMIGALEAIGAHVAFSEDNTLTICCAGVTTHVVPELVAGMQASILFVGPLLSRLGKAQVPRNMGCKLGFRGHEGHIEYLRPFGVKCEAFDGHLSFERSETLRSEKLVQLSDDQQKVRCEYFTQPLVTPTENLLMFLSQVTAFDVELQGIAQEPHVLQLIRALRQMGVMITGSHGIVKISGSHKPLKGFDVDLHPDHVDFYGTLVAIIATGGSGSVCFENCSSEAFQSLVRMQKFFQDIGIKLDRFGNGMGVDPSFFVPEEYFPRADEKTWKLDPGPWPAFPVDSLPAFVVLACTNRNPEMDIVVSNWMYEDGMRYAAVLKDLGMSVSVENPQKIRVRGTDSMFSHDRPVEVTCPDVIEGARAVFIAALARPGITTIKNIDPLLRRSPNFLEKYKKLGAQIEVIG